MQTETRENLDAEIRPMMNNLSLMTDEKEMLAEGNRFILRFPPERALQIATAMSFANPFFYPDVPPQAVRDLAVPLEDFAEVTMRAKLAAQRADQPNILVACAPKSASTFIQAALQSALDLPPACLFTATMDWNSAARHASHLREQELDELALIRAGLNRRGYVAQHHARSSLYTARLIDFYRIKPVVTYRNIFDTIVSLDDMVMKQRQNERTLTYNFFLDGLPSNYHTLGRDDRTMILAERQAMWLIQFYITWKRCAEEVGVHPLWVSYENDFLADKAGLAERLANHIGLRHADPARILAALEDRSRADDLRFNKGVTGRGKELSTELRDYVLTLAKAYRNTWDLSPLVGTENA